MKFPTRCIPAGFLALLIPMLIHSAAWADDKTTSGLKEALSVGIQEAVKKVGVTDGYYGNPEIKIPLPEKLQKGDAYIRKLGGSELSETLVKKMNQAAEKAAPPAVDIFSGAIKSMTITDAQAILTGGGSAATEYLKKNTSEDLRKAYQPIVKTSMEEVGAIKTYNSYTDKISKNPLAKSLDLDIVDYVTTAAIDGLFKMVAVEEQKIRENPAARATDLLKDVFGGLQGK